MRIALIGSAPSSVTLAPYDDPSWTIWSCSPGAYPYVKRADAHFELHKWEKADWFSPQYIDWMRAVPKSVYMIRPVPELANSVSYPKEDMVNRFGPYFFNSSLSWMFALAITQGATEIGLWGVDMSAQEEWIYQRSGCQYFIHFCKSIGIKVTLPHESDLLRPPPLYGFAEEDPYWVKMHARKAELMNRIQDALVREGKAREERLFLQGALDNVEYHLKTWVPDQQALALAYSQPDWTVPPLNVQELNAKASGNGVSKEPMPGQVILEKYAPLVPVNWPPEKNVSA